MDGDGCKHGYTKPCTLCYDEARELRYRQRIAGLEAALRAIEAHHVEQNRIKGRDENRSTTLRIVREALK